MRINPLLAVVVSVVMLIGTVLPTVQAQTTDMKRAQAASHSAKAYKRQGDLANAKNMFQIVLDSAPQNSSIRLEAEEDLSYYIPLMWVQRLLWDGKVQQAEDELLGLQLQFEDYPIRRQELGRILNNLHTPDIVQDAAAEKPIDERLVMQKIQAMLDSYYEKNGRYPTNRAELDEALHPDQTELNSFDIRRYASDGVGYLLVLRNKKDTGQTLTLQHTGLLQ